MTCVTTVMYRLKLKDGETVVASEKVPVSKKIVWNFNIADLGKKAV